MYLHLIVAISHSSGVNHLIIVQLSNSYIFSIYQKNKLITQFIILISAVTGLVIHIIMGHPNYVYGLSLAAGAFVGGAIGSKLLGHIREGILRIFLSISLLFVSSRLIFVVIDDL